MDNSCDSPCPRRERYLRRQDELESGPKKYIYKSFIDDWRICRVVGVSSIHRFDIIWDMFGVKTYGKIGQPLMLARSDGSLTRRFATSRARPPPADPPMLKNFF